MSSSPLTPDRVLIVDKRLVSPDLQPLDFIQLSHPRTKQEQSFAIDRQTKTIFEVIQNTRSHACWFIHDQYVLPDGSLYMITPMNLIFLLLPSIWTQARKCFIPLTKILNDSLKQLQFDEDFILEKLDVICDIDSDKHSIKFNEEKFFHWLRDRIDRLKSHVPDEEHAFDLICEYLPDDIMEYCQSELKLHGNVRYDTPVGQKVSSTTTTVVTKKVVQVTTKTKRCKT